MHICLKDYVGSFAENKDIAKELRLGQIIPALDKGETVTLDFEGIDGATQSFVHSLISDLFRKYTHTVLDNVLFKNCNKTIQKIVTIVSDYMQETQA